MKEIKPRSDINAVIRITGSKSITHRALITAGLAKGESVLEEFLACEDTLYTVKALREMGVGISVRERDAVVSGTGGDLAPSIGKKVIFLGNSGTSFRLLLSVAALGRGEHIFEGSPRMNERPIGDLVRALKTLGVDAACIDREDYPPVSIRAGGIDGGRVKIPGNISSQYISSILLASPYARKDVEIEVIGALVSRPYLDITLDVMKAFGVELENRNLRYFKTKSGQAYGPRRFRIEGDVSAASYFWGAAAVTGGTVITENIHPHITRQGDIAFLEILERMGCLVKREDDRVMVRGGPLSGVEADMATMPDVVPTLAAIALFADGETVIHNVSHLRHKESDRIGDTTLEWRRLGAEVKELEDGLLIKGGGRMKDAEVDPHNDHRLAMSLAIIGLMVPGIRIRDESCVDKSFPLFWDLWDSL